MPRHDGRADDAIRPTLLEPDWLPQADGSVLVRIGSTRVLCTAMIEEKVPSFLAGSGEGWVTSEYSMLPAATAPRNAREVTKGKPSGRTMEIQRLVGRALRSVLHRRSFGERTVWVDCDVLQADGGTRVASITGGFVALCLAFGKLAARGVLRPPVLGGIVSAISVGVVEGRPVLDLDYVEDSAADVDLNVVRTHDGKYIELQGTAERAPFRREGLDALLALADVGLDQLHALQRSTLDAARPGLLDKLLSPR